jgi:asparagine synthase (glutamine-hydrolysing)
MNGFIFGILGPKDFNLNRFKDITSPSLRALGDGFTMESESVFFHTISSHKVPMMASIHGWILLLNTTDPQTLRWPSADLSQSLDPAKTILDTVLRKGIKTLDRLEGHYSIVLYQERTQKLILQSDPLASVCLYIAHDKKNIAFSTLMSPLLKSGVFPKDLDETYIADYLSIYSVATQMKATHTIIDSISLLPPLNRWTFDVDNKHYEQIQRPPLEMIKDPALAMKLFRKTLDLVIRESTLGYEKVGLMLSGGLDSTIVGGLLATHHQDVFSYTQVPRFIPSPLPKAYIPDEESLVKAFIPYHLNIHPVFESSKGYDAYTVLDRYLDFMEGPYKVFENSHWIYSISQRAVKEGCDGLVYASFGNATLSFGSFQSAAAELFWGFHWISLWKELKQRNIKTKQSRLKIMLPILSSALPPHLALLIDPKDKKQLEALTAINPDFYKRMKMDKRFKHSAYDNDQRKILPLRKHQAAMMKDETLSLFGAVNTKMSLSYGIDCQDVTFDRRLMDLVKSFPASAFVHNGVERRMAREGYEDMIPSEISANVKYGVQGIDFIQRLLPHWSEIRFEINIALNHSLIQKYFDIPKLKRALELTTYPDPNDYLNSEVRLLMRTLIFYRYILKWEKYPS